MTRGEHPNAFSLRESRARTWLTGFCALARDIDCPRMSSKGSAAVACADHCDIVTAQVARVYRDGPIIAAGSWVSAVIGHKRTSSYGEFGARPSCVLKR